MKFPLRANTRPQHWRSHIQQTGALPLLGGTPAVVSAAVPSPKT